MRRVSAVVPGLQALLVAGLLVGIFAALLLHSRGDLREEIHRRIIERDAAVLHPVALQQLGEAVADPTRPPPHDALLAVLRSARQNGMLGVAVHDAEGSLLRAVPATGRFIDLPPEDYLELAQHRRISRYHPDFILQPMVGADDSLGESSPVLEVLLPLHLPDQPALAGVAQYWLDARHLAQELARLDEQIAQQTNLTLGLGATLICLIVAGAYAGLARAQRVIAERNARLVHANLELALAAKASVLGQITSHLLHGLQGPVAGLHAVIAARGGAGGNEDWQTAADYTARLQKMIGETVALLSERSAGTGYELGGDEFAGLLRERHRAGAAARGVALVVAGGFTGTIESNRGNLLCLLTGNLIDNALEASAPGATVHVAVDGTGDTLRLTVTDQGPGLPEEVRRRLFQPGQSRKPGGTGLGLAISHLLALQLGASLHLRETGPAGTIFTVTVPRRAPA